MDLTECAWCGAEIEDGGLDHKGLMFCSTECIEEWDEDSLTADDIDLGDLDDILPDEDVDLDDDLVIDEDAI